MGSTAIRTSAIWQSINSFRLPGVRVINTASILCDMKLSFSTWIICWITYFRNYLRYTRSHRWQLVDSSISLFSKSLTLPNVCASFSPNCWSHSWASQDLEGPFTPRLLMNAPKDSWMTYAMDAIWLLNAGVSIADTSRVVGSSWVIE